jgi:glycerol-3-phosphate dehydrogenase subunit C
MKACNFERSMRMGAPLFESIARSGAPIVATGCGTCKIQIEQGTGRPVVHPLALLRDALVPPSGAADPARPR